MPGTAKVTIAEKEWQVSIASLPWELSAGLGGVSSLPAGNGMLFDLGTERTVQVTTEPMLFPIDIIFVSDGSTVVDVVRDIDPGNVLTQETPVRYFLEVNAGEAEGIHTGNVAEIEQLSSGFETTMHGAFVEVAAILGVAVLVGVVTHFAVKQIVDTERTR